MLDYTPPLSPASSSACSALAAERIPLLAQADDSIIAWYQGAAVTRAEFLAQALGLAETLPDHPYVINLAESRYHFTLGFCAALLRNQITLLPPNRAADAIRLLREHYPDCYGLGNGARLDADLPLHRIVCSEALPPTSIVPTITANQSAAIAFTSGSTGNARPQLKTWAALNHAAANIAQRLSFASVHILATVPFQHMYGLETSVCLPLATHSAFVDTQALFPADIELALRNIPSPRVLVTTPVHLRALRLADLDLPPLQAILSATAPLPTELAAAIEHRYAAPVYEIYGFSEAGSVATRQTTRSAYWQLLGGLRFGTQQEHRLNLEADYLAEPVAFPDIVTRHGRDGLELHGRGTDVVNIAGHRASLQELNHALQAIDGVEDGVFLAPAEDGRPDARLLAFAVAPHSTAEQIIAMLRHRIDRAFLPRPLYLVARLPRAPTGKLPKEALEQLLLDCQSSAQGATP